MSAVYTRYFCPRKVASCHYLPLGSVATADQGTENAEIPTYQAYGTTVALTEADIAKLPEANRRRVLTFRRIAEIAERA